MDERCGRKDMEDRAAIAQLVRQVQDGDRAAFRRLVESFQKTAYYSAYRILSREEDARDAVQDAFVRAMENLPQLQQPERFAGWFKQIVISVAYNARRTRAVRATDSLEARSETTLHLRDPYSKLKLANPDGPDEGPQATVFGRVQDGLDRLTDKQRLAVTLFYYEQWPVARIAEFMESTDNAVKQLLLKGREKLAEFLGVDRETAMGDG